MAKLQQRLYVDLGTEKMRAFHLPVPPQGMALVAAVKASLNFLALGPKAPKKQKD
jgi:hypothetical protein